MPNGEDVNCCTDHLRGAARCFGFVSRLSARRVRRKGLEPTQRHLIEQISAIGLDRRRVLEIGCGVGIVHHTLLERGAAHATGIDLTEQILGHARQRARQHGLEDRVDYVAGDYVELHAALPEADIAVLDKVVCCYPDPARLLGAVAANARLAVGLTYPRDVWLSRMGTRVWNALFWIMGSGFRVFVHDPAVIEAELSALRMSKVTSRDTVLWRTQLFVAQ